MPSGVQSNIEKVQKQFACNHGEPNCSLEAEATDDFYNVGTGVQTSIKELCDTILDLKHSELKVTYNPYSGDDARRLVQNRIGCPNKASEDLCFTYKYDLRTGLQRLIDWRYSNL